MVDKNHYGDEMRSVAIHAKVSRGLVSNQRKKLESASLWLPGTLPLSTSEDRFPLLFDTCSADALTHPLTLSMSLLWRMCVYAREGVFAHTHESQRRFFKDD